MIGTPAANIQRVDLAAIGECSRLGANISSNGNHGDIMNVCM